MWLSESRGSDAPRTETVPANTSPTVLRALRLIEDGVLDRANIDALCERLRISQRQLRRLFREQLGTTPVHVAKTRRAQFARQLIDTTSLPMARVATAAGFGSTRRFNDVMQEVYGCSPSQLRSCPRPQSAFVELRVPVARPFDWNRLLGFLAPCAIPGLEEIRDGQYLRTARYRNVMGEIAARYDASENAICVRVSPELTPKLFDVASGIRRLFDTDMEPATVMDALRRSEALAARLARCPGLRVPGSFEHFETTVRAIVAQHAEPQEAMEILVEMVRKYGKPLEGSQSGLTHAFPSPRQLSRARLTSVGLPKRRARTIETLAEAVDQGALRLDGSPSLESSLERIRSIPGVGAWTADYIAMRVYREANAFPTADLALRKALAADGVLLSAKELEDLSAEWKPWRAYAAMCIWETMDPGLWDGVPVSHGLQDQARQLEQVEPFEELHAQREAAAV